MDLLIKMFETTDDVGNDKHKSFVKLCVNNGNRQRKLQDLNYNRTNLSCPLLCFVISSSEKSSHRTLDGMYYLLKKAITRCVTEKH